MQSVGTLSEERLHVEDLRVGEEDVVVAKGGLGVGQVHVDIKGGV